MKKILLLSSISALLLVVACSPKTTEKTKEKEEPKTTTAPKPKPDEKLSPCPSWANADNKDAIIDNYVLCKDEIRAKNYDKAYDLWKKVYDVAPAADGRRNTIYTWGLEIFNDKFKKETDSAKKKAHVDQIMKLYDEMIECYPDDVGYTYGRKGFDLFYNYPDYATDKEKYDLFKKSIDLKGMKTQAFVLNPFTDLLIRQFNSKAVSMPEAQKYANQVIKIVDNGIKTAKGNELEGFKVVKGYAPVRLEELEATKGFYDCSYYKRKYLYIYEEDKSDCDAMIETYSILRWGDCPETDAKLREINAAYESRCVVAVAPTTNPGTTTNPTKPRGPSCNDMLRNGQYGEAIQCLETKYNQSSDESRKASYAYSIASVLTRQKQFSKAREWANKALQHRPGWGKAYLLIGNMYASSGAICGPGTGWKSQVVIWPAMDMWEKAKRDPESSSKAQRQINKYSQYLPTKEDGFMNGNVKDGQSYKIDCWINRTTTVRLK